MKRLAITLAACLSLGALAQEAKPPAEPAYPSAVYSIDANGALVPLEGQTLHLRRHYRVLGFAGGTTAFVADGERAGVRLTEPAGKLAFAVRFPAETDPMEVVHLYRLQPGDSSRALPLGEFNGWGRVTQVGQVGGVDVKAVKYGASSFRLVPLQALAPGEYCFLLGQLGGSIKGKQIGGSCFGVDGGKSESKR